MTWLKQLKNMIVWTEYLDGASSRNFRMAYLITAVNDIFLILCDAAETLAEADGLAKLSETIKQYWKSYDEENNILYYRIDERLKYARRRVDSFQRIREYIRIRCKCGE